ncbi:MAG TPA: pseudouridine-5'-phosphate glycosidase [Acidobacteriota bacterium]
MTGPLEIRPEIEAALHGGGGVVALESTVIAHGLPRPHNLETALAMEAAVREAGAVPATIGLLEGRIVIGLTPAEIERLAAAREVFKVSRRDFAAVLASGAWGATTVAATMFAARQAGIRILATGGIGGVHRGGESSLDISADLTELGRTPVAVVCSGCKVILDLARTLEVLETQGVPVIGYQTSEFPAFYVRGSGLALEHRVDTPEQAAQRIALQWRLRLSTGVVIAQAPPGASALDRAEVETLLAEALAAAEAQGVAGKALTPFLLDQLSRKSAGRTLAANVALLIENARLAAQIARAAALMTE